MIVEPVQICQILRADIAKILFRTLLGKFDFLIVLVGLNTAVCVVPSYSSLNKPRMLRVEIKKKHVVNANFCQHPRPVNVE